MRKILLPALAMACVLVACDKKDTVSVSVSATNTAASEVAPAPSEFDSLKGKWARTDGDYVLEIKTIAADGKAEAGYYNPSPINVSKALAIKEASGTKVFVELQDEGYPGCTYSLTFDPATTQLHGQYFQAAMQQTYDVVFAKIKE